MVPSSMLAISTSDERLSCDGFSLGQTIHFGSLEFIVDHFGDLSFSPMGDSSDVVVMGSNHGGCPHNGSGQETSPRGSPWLWMEEEGSTSLLLGGMARGLRPPQPQPENPPTVQATTTTPLWQATPWSDTNLPLERWRTCQEVAQRWSKLAGGQAVAMTCPRRPPQHEPLADERVLVMGCATTQARSEGVISTHPPPPLSVGPVLGHRGQGHRLFTSTHRRRGG
jgi:hypothetical protein